MADKSINELNQASELYDTGLTVVYQNSQTQSISGLALKTYAQNAVVDYAEEAAAIAIQDATDAATTATNAKNDAIDAKDDAVAAKNAAQSAQSAIESMSATSTKLNYDQNPTVTKSIVSGHVNLAFGLPVGAPGLITNVARTSGTGAPGTTDTYTITTNGPAGSNTFTFQVYNGEDGTGTGDMKRSVYDPNQTIYNTSGGIPTYVSNQIGNITAASVGAIANPSTKSNGQSLTYNGTDWAASTLPKPTTPLTSGQQYTCVLNANAWSSFPTGYKSQSIDKQTCPALDGLKATYTVPPLVDVVLSHTSGDATVDSERLDAWGLVSSVVTGTDSITAYCCTNEAPTVNIPIVITVWE